MIQYNAPINALIVTVFRNIYTNGFYLFYEYSILLVHCLARQKYETVAYKMNVTFSLLYSEEPLFVAIL